MSCDESLRPREVGSLTAQLLLPQREAEQEKAGDKTSEQDC